MSRLNLASRLLFVVPAALALSVSACSEEELAAIFGEGSGDVADAGDTGGQVGDDTESRGPVEYDPAVDARFVGLTTVTPRFEPSAADFYRLPWPLDSRVTVDGAPELSDFPNPSDILLVEAYAEVVETYTRGFSTLPVLYTSLSGALVPDMLPPPAGTLSAASTVQLVRLGDGQCTERYPLEVTFVTEAETYTAANTLRAATVNGWVLEPATPYAFVVLRSLGETQGTTVGVAPGFRDALAGTHPDAALNAAYAPLRDCLDTSGIDPSMIAVAAVFTTQDPVRETRLMRDVALNEANDPEVVQWVLEEELSNSRFTVYGGRYTTPIFQRGLTPYAGIGDGGGVVLGDDGMPEIQRYEEVPFSVAVPTDVEGPLPVLLWEDGTAVGSASDRAVQFGHLGEDPFNAALERGFAIVNFQPQFHAGRSGPGADEVLHSFNFLNPESGRTAFRQQVVDTSYFVRLLRDHQDQMPGIPALDTDRMVYGGHSQGAIVGAMVAGVDDAFDGYFLNGVGAVLGIVIIERKDPLDIASTLGGLLQVSGVLDRFHPIVQLAQLGADPVDPANYVRYWRGWEGFESGNHVLMSNGYEDDTTHFTQIDAITIAADAAPIRPTGWDVDPFRVWQRESEVLPISGNRTSLDGSPLTLASYLDGDQGHFTIYNNASVMRMGADFWLSALDGTPVADR